MNIQSQSVERTGMLRIIDGVNSDRKARAIKAGLGDLPGVHSVEVIGSSVRVRFVPAIVTEQQFYPAIKTAGFQASGFQTAL
jgi:copper chaperone CopZ